ncbi:MAG: signal recognition particle-docking protein FtsY [Spirochaetales bacterium]
MARGQFTQKIKAFFSGKNHIDEEFFENLTDILVEGDVGAKTAFELVEKLEKNCKSKKITAEDEIKNELAYILQDYVKSIELAPDPKEVSVYLVLGVNGVGKTTSVAKMASFFNRSSQYPVVMAAADTFRAAAIDQLLVHGERLGVRVVSHKHGADPAAVVFDAAESISAKGGGLVLADTAGRLHNKENLVRELQKIDRIAASKASENAYKKILVLDATTGQNALRQAEVFHEAVGVDAVILTKYDSSAKGGVAFSLGRDLGIPVAFICFGESYNDIAVFDSARYIREFMGQ